MSDRCCHCLSSVGPTAKVQPTNADGETWCPPCFVFRRMAAEPERFNATQAAPVRCMLCGWVSVSFGALPGKSLMCGHCGKFSGLKLRLDEMPFTKIETDAVAQAARDAGYKNPRRLRS